MTNAEESDERNSSELEQEIFDPRYADIAETEPADDPPTGSLTPFFIALINWFKALFYGAFIAFALGRCVLHC